jgi:DNA repair exonuclease SbcCD nuclease subunit
MKFLHTADWQIGMKAVHVSEAGEQVRQVRIETVRRLVNVARDHDAEFILVAGDAFEDNAVERVLVQRVADILSSSKLPVFILPGNHDPTIPGSVWEHPAWKSCENVSVLTEEKPIEIPGGVLYPCPLREKRSGKDPTAWIEKSTEAGVHIGLAHGTVEAIHQEEPEYPIRRDAAARAGLDYLALGHWHSVATYPDVNGAIRMAYSGTPETTRFGERDSGNVLIVEIPSGDGSPVVTPLRVGALEWKVIDVDLREERDLCRLREDVEAIENPDKTLLVVRARGLLIATEQDQIPRIQEIMASRFLFASADFSGVKPSPKDESWVANLPAGIIRETARRLRDLADQDLTRDRPSGTSPEIASRALMELYSLMEGVS